MGYRIPKDIPVIANDWVINTDPTIFEDPMEFKPERWLQRPNLPSSAFGFGKRMCPGQHLGRQSVVTALARLVWSFDISYAYEKRKRIEINPFDMMLGLVALPTSFKASIKVRSPQRKVVIEREWAAVEKDENFYLAQIGGC
jgi:cytochrome P450